MSDSQDMSSPLYSVFSSPYLPSMCSPALSPIQSPHQPFLYSAPYPHLYPSPPVDRPPYNAPSSQIRFKISLQAPTASAQRIDEPRLTYLNKGQYYMLDVKDRNGYDGLITSTVAITFHDESHRSGAADYWKFWIAQQKDIANPQAVEFDEIKSIGLHSSETNQFDRISFTWHGKQGASLCIKFNCLSTDFSRIKGVKGVPLRLEVSSQVETKIEKTYCRIKLFRDKGAERKNKDDQKHIERQLSKANSDLQWFASSQPITIFHETVPVEETYPSLKRTILDYDATYIPQRKRRIAKLSLLIRFETSNIYRAIYLEQLTAKELTDKIVQRMTNPPHITSMVRKRKNGDKTILVQVDDDVVKAMAEEQDIYVTCQSSMLILDF